jgi:hypothetical protein
MAWRLTRALNNSEHPLRTASELTMLGMSANMAQLMHLLLRHWWPAAFVSAVFSRRVRRAVVMAAAVDSIIEWRRLGPDMDPARFALALRLEDAAYGAGVWSGALRARSMRALLPHVSR